MSNEHEDSNAAAVTAAITDDLRVASIAGTADTLARVQDLLKADPDYAEVLGISKRGMDYINGAEATLRADALSI